MDSLKKSTNVSATIFIGIKEGKGKGPKFSRLAFHVLGSCFKNLAFSSPQYLSN